MPLHDVIVNGMALNDQGLTETSTINGYGLNTYGMLWGCNSFWYEPYYSNDGVTIQTAWSLMGNIPVNTWSLCCAGVSTAWTLCISTDQLCE